MSAAFLLAAARAPRLSQAIAPVLQGLPAPQDALIGWDAPEAVETLPALTCSNVMLNSSLRALAYAAQTLQSGQASLLLAAGGLPGDYAAFLLAAPEIIGARNLEPLALLASWSFDGLPRALALAEIAEKDLACRLEGPAGALAVYELLTSLREKKARWGLVSVAGAFLTLERV